MIYPIRYFGDPILRQVARPVTRFDANLVELVDDMFETMFDANGIGLAATQIGIPRRIFVAVEIDPAFDDEGDDTASGADSRGGSSAGSDASHAAIPTGADTSTDATATVARAAAVGDGHRPAVASRMTSSGSATRGDRDLLAIDRVAAARGVTAKHVLINPEFVVQDGVQHGPDGCLSLPGLYVEELRRYQTVRLRYHDLHGQRREFESEGRFAHVLQHEYDHLQGVLFFDHLPTAERQAFLEANRAELADMQRQAKALLKELRRSPVPVTVG